MSKDNPSMNVMLGTALMVSALWAAVGCLYAMSQKDWVVVGVLSCCMAWFCWKMCRIFLSDPGEQNE